MKRMILIIFVAAFFIVKPAAAQIVVLSVSHEHTFRACRGHLMITPEKIEYQTVHKEDSWIWSYSDLKQIKIESPTTIELVSYEDQKPMLGRDRIFRFKVLEGEISSETSALLIGKTARPLTTSVMPVSEGAPIFEVQVKHLHRFGGCLGALRIYHDRIIYESKDTPPDSRYWRYRDIQSFSQSERFRFEVVSFEDKWGGPKTYNFQLREELPTTAYDYVWARIYPSRLSHDERLSHPKSESRPSFR